MRLEIIKSLIPVCFSLAITGVCLFVSAGRLNWSNAWVLLGLSFAGGLSFIVGRDPGLAAERRNIQGGKSWDKVIVGTTVLLGPMATWITAGLDNRFHWSNGMSSQTTAAGVTVSILGAAMIAWAMRANRFFSSVVRIQKDRGHTVVAEGPYRFVRHPGYAGMLASTLATPMILGSRWAFAPAGATAAVLLLRTVLEDHTLRDELDSYTDYARRVRYKLIPALW